MRISDWSSDVCSSDLPHERLDRHHLPPPFGPGDRRRIEARALQDITPVEQQPRIDIPGHAVEVPVDQVACPYPLEIVLPRSEERRVGKECVSTCRSRCARYH